jgi:hypothetical protein
MRRTTQFIARGRNLIQFSNVLCAAACIVLAMNSAAANVAPSHTEINVVAADLVATAGGKLARITAIIPDPLQFVGANHCR